MGFYINQNSNGIALPKCNKADYLILDGGIEIEQPKRFKRNIVCVVENGPFDAALYCYDKDELNRVNDPNDTREKRWIIHPEAAKLSGYKQ